MSALEPLITLPSLTLDFEEFVQKELGLSLLLERAPVCRFFLRGYCPKGQSCPLRHPPRTKTVVCKHWLRGLCIAAGTPIDLSNGLSVPIELVDVTHHRILTHDSAEAVKTTGNPGYIESLVTAHIDNGRRLCLEITLADGRKLVCTPDHRILTADHGWRTASQLASASKSDMLIVGMQSPLDMRDVDRESVFELRFDSSLSNCHMSDTSISQAIRMDVSREKCLAFARLLGYTLASDTLWGVLHVQHPLDISAVHADIYKLTGKASMAISPTTDKPYHTIFLPVTLWRGLSHYRQHSKVFGCYSTPDSFVRECVAAYFGRNGDKLTLCTDGTFDCIRLVHICNNSESTSYVHRTLQELKCILKTRFRINSDELIQTSNEQGIYRFTLNICKSSTLTFHDTISIRYCANNQQRLSVMASWYRGLYTVRYQYRHIVQLAIKYLGKSAVLNYNSDNCSMAIAWAVKQLSLTESIVDWHSLPTNQNLFVAKYNDVNYITPRAFLIRSCVDKMIFSSGVKSYNRKTLQVTQEIESHTQTSIPEWRMPVVGVRTLGYRQVYDLTIPTTHNFLANGIVVHNCKKGDNCEFLHEYNMKRMPECWFYTKYGECSNAECLYLHIDADSRTKECPWFARGFCKHGSSCRAKHVKKLVCPLYITGFCPLGPDCSNGHPKFEISALLNEEGDDMSQSFASGGRLDHIVCFKCGQRGHFANQCQFSRQGGVRPAGSGENQTGGGR